MKNNVLALAAIALVFICSEATLACWCRRPVFDTEKEFRAAVAKELRASSIVFSGEPLERNRSGLRFRVDMVWKGEPVNEIILTSKNYVEQGDCTENPPCYFTECVYPFEMGKKYLVYARIEDGLLNVSLCSRTQLFDKAERDVNELERIASKNPRQMEKGISTIGSSPRTAKANSGTGPHLTTASTGRS